LQKHEHGYLAACAAEAAGLQDHFWEMHDLLYQNQSEWHEEETGQLNLFGSNPYHAKPDAREVFSSYAAKLGLDVERFKQDIDSDEVKARISSDRVRVDSLKIDRTLTVYINGHHVEPTSRTVEALHSIIDAELGVQQK